LRRFIPGYELKQFRVGIGKEEIEWEIDQTQMIGKFQ
jgi:hypothetical protein